VRPAAHPFDKELRRGVVLRYLEKKLDDPNRETRWKYAVVVNFVLPGDPILYFRSTSNPTFYASGEHDRHILRVPAGTYPFLSRDSVFDMKTIEKKPLQVFRDLHSAGHCKSVGDLSAEHLREIDVKVWASERLPLRDIEAITGKKPKIEG
jgi:hypothetical protein